MRRSVLLVTTAVAAGVLALTACSSSSKSNSSPTSGGAGSSTAAGGSSSGSSPATGGGTIKVGVISDLTGVASSGFITAEKGVKAFVEGVNASGGVNGQKLAYVMGDSTSTPPGALTAAQKLVQTDKVFAVIDISSVFYGAEPYLLKAGVPAIGGAFDGPEWNLSSNNNMFATTGTTNYKAVSSVGGTFLKSLGVTTCGNIGYSSSASSQAAASAIEKSCVAAGLKSGYLNNQVPFGSTDMGAIALAVKKAGVDGMYVPVVPATGFALAGALKQIGVPLKTFVLPTGYGSDLLQSSAAVAAAQGYIFVSVGAPIEANTPATQKFAADLALVGVTGPPTFAEQEGYIAMTALQAGLKASGASPSAKAFTTALRGVHDFDGNGLMAPAKVDFSNFTQFGAGAGSAGCIFAAKLNGKTFSVVPGTPVCGHDLP